MRIKSTVKKVERVCEVITAAPDFFELELELSLSAEASSSPPDEDGVAVRELVQLMLLPRLAFLEKMTSEHCWRRRRGGGRVRLIEET